MGLASTVPWVWPMSPASGCTSLGWRHVSRSIYSLRFSPRCPRRALEDPVAGKFKMRKKPDQVTVSGEHLSPPACPTTRVIKQELSRALAASRIPCSGQKPAMSSSCSSVRCGERGRKGSGSGWVEQVPESQLGSYYSPIQTR